MANALYDTGRNAFLRGLKDHQSGQKRPQWKDCGCCYRAR